MTDVFISYAREDRARIEKLAAALDAEGVDLWWDHRLAGGSEFTKETEARLNAAKAILVAWSKASIDSIWVGDEAAVGRKKSNLVPIALDPVEPKLGFRGIHTIDFARWNGDRGAPEFVNLVGALKARISGEAAPLASIRSRRWPMRTPVLAGIGVVAAALVGFGLFIAKPFETGASQSPQAAGATGAAQPEKTAPQASSASIAVLPFADMSEKKDQEYFADGMAEEILNVLVRVDGLTVASRTSSFQFRNQTVGTPKIAAELGVRHILAGSVRKAGDTVRITVQLIDTSKDAHLWSETFDRPLTTKNLFAIQDEVAKSVVAALREKIGARVGDAGPAPARTGDVDAYGLFLKARAMFQTRRDPNAADKLVEEAVRLDPKFADALALRAGLHLVGDQNGGDFGDAKAARDQGKKFAHQALALDEKSSLAIAVLALAEYLDHSEGAGERPYAELFPAYERALALDPNNTIALQFQGNAYATAGDLEKAIALHRRCVAIDPSYVNCRSNVATDLVAAGRRKEAGEVIDAAVAVGVTAIGVIALAELGRRDAFMFAASNSPSLRGWRKFDALYEAVRNPAGDHRALAAELKALYVDNGAPSNIYTLLYALGDYSLSGGRGATLWTDTLRPYRHSPEFKQHMRASGVVDYWKTHGFPKQCRAIGKDDFACD